jgi:hypothetical protein
MKDIKVKELMNKKIDMELEIIKTVNEIIQRFQDETGIGVKNIDLVLTPRNINSYMVTNSVALLDLDSSLEFEFLDENKNEEHADLYSCFLKMMKKPRQLLLFKDWK